MLLDKIEVTLLCCLEDKTFYTGLLPLQNFFGNQSPISFKFWRLPVHLLHGFERKTGERGWFQTLDGVFAGTPGDKSRIMRGVIAFRIKTDGYFVAIAVIKKGPHQSFSYKAYYFLYFTFLKKKIFLF